MTPDHTLLITHADVLVAMAAARRELRSAWPGGRLAAVRAGSGDLRHRQEARGGAC